MKKCILFRLPTSEQGTFGYMIYDGKVIHTIELPDKDNQRNVSCIPTGDYTCSLFYSHHFKRYLYNVKNVNGRSYILIHSGNFAGDTSKGWQSHFNGCIGLGLSRGIIRNKFGKEQQAILNSRTALRRFMTYMNNEDFKLHIRSFYGNAN